MTDCIIFDWLTFSSFDMSLDDAILLLGLCDRDWEYNLSSSYLYAYRARCGGISIHYTPDNWNSFHPGLFRNPGICVELTGQGCREYETYGRGDFPRLLFGLSERGCRVTRLDLAFDDFSGLIDINHMAKQAENHHYTARSQRRSITRDCPDGDLDHDGISVCHGSRSSRIFIRCYDKRCERGRYEIPHWVRLEIQFRAEDAEGVARALLSDRIGSVFSGVLTNYLNYRDELPSDSNRRRWPVSDWWQNLINGIAPIAVHTKKDVVYNLSKLDEYVFGQCRNACKTAVAIYGMYGFAEKLIENKKPLPAKYRDLLSQAEINNAAILNELVVMYDDA